MYKTIKTQANKRSTISFKFEVLGIQNYANELANAMRNIRATGTVWCRTYHAGIVQLGSPLQNAHQLLHALLSQFGSVLLLMQCDKMDKIHKSFCVRRSARRNVNAAKLPTSLPTSREAVLLQGMEIERQHYRAENENLKSLISLLVQACQNAGVDISHIDVD